jgi:hypothetical protein
MVQRTVDMRFPPEILDQGGWNAPPTSSELGTSLKSQEQVCSLFKAEPHKRLRSSEVDLTDSFIAS